MTALLVLRPEPGASATAARVRALGREAVIAPLFTVVPTAWEPPDPAEFDALLFTSANAARLGGAALARYAHLPAYAVGEATARAARAAGFAAIRTGEGDAGAVLALAERDGAARLLHLAGREHREVASPIGITRRLVYASDAVDALPEQAIAALASGAVTLLHSSRAAALFRALVDQASVFPATVSIAALSGPVLDAAGAGWCAASAALSPSDDALLAVALRMCDQVRE